MALRIISSSATGSRCQVIVEGDTYEEVSSSAARELAVQEGARHGLSKPGTSGNESTYPVDANGQYSDALAMGQGTVTGYRRDFKVSGM